MNESDPLLTPTKNEKDLKTQRSLRLIKSAKSASDILRRRRVLIGERERRGEGTTAAINTTSQECYSNGDVAITSSSTTKRFLQNHNDDDYLDIEEMEVSRHSSMKSFNDDEEEDAPPQDINDDYQSTTRCTTKSISTPHDYSELLTQIPSIIVATILGIIVGIPFGATYFPLGFFPLDGEFAFGLRLFIFSTVICQMVLTFTSQFTNPIGLQIVENVPFYHAIAQICIEELGHGIDALSNLMIILAFTTILVGISFYILGALELGRVIYFIPKHVLVGLIGGIGFFILEMSVEVVIHDDFSFTMAGFHALFQHFDLFTYVLFFEATLRLLTYVTRDTKTGMPQFPLLAPIFYCSIPPMFFLWQSFFGVTFQQAQNAGYLFSTPNDGTNDGTTDGVSSDESQYNTSFWNKVLDIFTDPHLMDPWRVLRLDHLSSKVFIRSIPTIVGMTLFSLIHVPIYVPALNLSTNQDADINNELLAHGWSNLICGFLGGFQNYMGYSSSVAYAKAGGKGKLSSIAVALFTLLFYFIGPTVCMYIPRCMAGVILLHLGIDLIQESLIDGYHDFGRLEYFGIVFVSLIISIYGIEEGLLAGVLTALSVFIAQSVNVQNPINGHTSAAMLSSSKWNRSAEAKAILDDASIGCSRVLIIQLQGHLFFGNLSKLTDSICYIIREHELKHGKVWILILDFTLVLGIDGSAAMEISRIKDIIHDEYDVSLCVYVTGEKSNKSFPCDYKLIDNLLGKTNMPVEEGVYGSSFDDKSIHSLDQSMLHRMDETIDILHQERMLVQADEVCHSLDEALKFAEDTLIAKSNKSLCDDLISEIPLPIEEINDSTTIEKEKLILKELLQNLLFEEYYSYSLPLINNLKRQVYNKGDMIWESGSTSDSAEFVVRGTLVGIQDEENDNLEEIESGQIIGESALVQNMKRTCTVKCQSEVAVLYSLSRKTYQRLLKQSPHVAMCIQIITIRNLSFRARHVSHNIFHREGRNLSI